MDATVPTIILAVITTAQTCWLEWCRRRYPGRTDVYERPPKWSVHPPGPDFTLPPSERITPPDPVMSKRLNR
jgi:hypothetical protein